MLNNIKEILLRDIQEEVENYDKTKERLDEIESRLEEIDLMIRPFSNSEKRLKRPVIPIMETKRYSFFEKVLFKRREYLDMQKRNSEIQAKYKADVEEYEKTTSAYKNEKSKLEEEQQNLQEVFQEMKKIKEKIEQIKNAKTIKDLNLSFDQAIELLNNNGIEVFLDECDKEIIENESEFSSEKDIVLVHKTGYYPTDDSIKSPLRLDAKETDIIHFGENKFEMSFVHGRDTIHFVVNGEVTSHEFGDFDKRKYAIIIPFDGVSHENLDSLCPYDTFFESQVATNNGYVLCPLREVSEIQKKNPHTKVIGYKGESVDDFANAFITMLGYKKEAIKSNSWGDSTDEKKYVELVKGKYKLIEHSYSKEATRENLITEYNKIIAFIDSLKKYKENGIVYNIDEFIYALFDEKNYINRQYGIIEREGSKLIPSITTFISNCYNHYFKAGIFLKDCMNEDYEDSLTDAIQSNLGLLLYKLKKEFSIDISKEMTDTMSLLAIKSNALTNEDLSKVATDNITDEETRILFDKLYKDGKINTKSDLINMVFLIAIVKEVYKTKEITEQPVSSKKR